MKLLKIFVDPEMPNEDDKAYTIWSDLPKKKIEDIAGVEWVVQTSEHCFRVLVDPRYDEEDVVNEIVLLAEKK
jgi:hypothetical protein